MKYEVECEMKQALDLTGQTSGRLLVLERVDNYVSPKGIQKSRWLVRCLCGAEKVLIGSNLVRKDQPTRSCGCLQPEAVVPICKQMGLANKGRKSPNKLSFGRSTLWAA
jgi:hypothetical protein